MISGDCAKTLPHSLWWFTIPVNDRKTLTGGQDQDLKIVWTAFYRMSSKFAIEIRVAEHRYLELSI